MRPPDLGWVVFLLGGMLIGAGCVGVGLAFDAGQHRQLHALVDSLTTVTDSVMTASDQILRQCRVRN